MSEENLQQILGYFIENLNIELDAVNQKYPDDAESENSAKCLEKLNIYTRCTMNLINTGRNYTEKFEYEQYTDNLDDGNAKTQNDLNVVHNCWDNRIKMVEQAISSILEGRHRKECEKNELKK